MPSQIDRPAARKLIQLREETGMSPEAVAKEIQAASLNKDWKRGAVHAYTIRRAESGLVPSLRSRHVIAKFYGVHPGEIWDKDAWIPIETRQAVAA